MIKKRKEKTRNLIKRCKCPNNRLFIIGLVSLIVFLLVELIIRIYNLYKSAPFVDIPSHFFAGIALATAIYWISSLTLMKRKYATSLFFTLVGALFWEVLETVEEWVITNPNYLRDVFFWDGFWDIIVTVIGGAAALLLLYYFKKKSNFLKEKQHHIG